MQSINDQKKELRSRCRQIRLSMSEQQRKEADKAITEAVLRLIRLKKPDRLFTYVSCPPVEVDTSGLIGTAFASSLPVAVPKCIPDTHAMDFYIIDSTQQLISGYCNIPEPDTSVCPIAELSDNDMCIVPGLAFDRSGFRVGFGGGYYDRLISSCRRKAPGALFVGICYESCLFDSLPHDSFDQKVSYMITENSVIPISG